MKDPVARKAQPLDYAPAAPPPPASPRRVFMCLLPGEICVASLLTSAQIENAFPNGDSRNFGGACLALLTAPVGLVFGVFAIREALRPRGLRALLRGAGWNALTVLASWLAIWAIIRFGLL